jgi:hypothetical protein
MLLLHTIGDKMSTRVVATLVRELPFDVFVSSDKLICIPGYLEY